MTGMHAALDHVIVPIVIAWSVIEWLWSYPRFVRAIRPGVPGARRSHYWSILVPEWLITAGLLVLWVIYRRPWSALLLGSSTPWRLGIGLAIAALVVTLLGARRRAILARPELLEVVRRKVAQLEPLLPHSADECRLWVALAVTAGVCEELIFRGFMMWYFWAWTGPSLALVISSAIFGFGHIYLGLPQVPKTAAVGAVLAAIVLLTGSLWPAMIIHAAIDWTSGDLGFHTFPAATPNTSGAAKA